MNIKMNVIMLLVLLFSLSANAGLEEAIRQYDQTIRDNLGKLSSRECEAYIAILEKEIVDTDRSDPLRFHARMRQADALRRLGDLTGSLDVLDSVANNSEAPPHSKIGAMNQSIAISFRSGEDFTKTLARVDALTKAAEELVGKDPSFYRFVFGGNMTKASLCHQYALLQYQEMIDRGEPEQAGLVGLEYKEQAVEYLFDYLDQFDNTDIEISSDLHNYLHHMNFDQAAALYTTASILIDIADMYESNDDDIHAGRNIQMAINKLEKFFADCPLDSRFSQPAGRKLLQLLEPSLSDWEFIEQVSLIVEKTAAGHELITYLNTVARDWSNDKENLLAASAICELVIRAERNWFPEEYEQHVNYQEAFLQKAQNLIELEDIQTAEWMLQELEANGIRGDFFYDWHKRLQKKIDARYEQMLTDGIPSE